MTLAFVLIECARGLATSTEQAIKQLQGVLETHKISSGTDYDFIVKVQTENESQLKSTILSIKHVAGIAAVAVSVVYGATQ